MSDAKTNPPEDPTVIIDIGQALTKVGFTGEQAPRSIFPTVVGKPKFRTMAGIQTQEIYVGEDTTRMRGVLKLDYPITRGNVLNWEEYFEILNHIFYGILRIEPKECNVIYLIPPLTPPETAQYFARVLFETHQFKRVALIDSATTASFSVGFTTGLSIEMGAGITTITPVMDGRIYAPSIRRLNLAGMDVEEYLGKLLTQYGIFKKKEIITEIKEKALQITLDPDTASRQAENEQDFVLPDGEIMKINPYIACLAPEILFSPQLDGVISESLPQAVISSLQSIDPGYLRILLGHIIISGGTSYITGLKARLLQELETLLPSLGEIPPIEEFEEEIEEDEENDPTNSENAEIPFETSEQKFENCPKCGELVDIKTSVYCPKCKAKLQWDQIEILSDEQKRLSRKQRKIIKKTAISDEEFDKIIGNVLDEYGDESDYEELIDIENVMDKKLKLPPTSEDSHQNNKPAKEEEPLINIILDEDRQYAAYKGAAILGSISTFQAHMVDYATFQEQPDRVIMNFHEVMEFSK